MSDSILTVSEVNQEINDALKRNPKLWNCWVTGEISNFKDHIPSGHWYFTLKDEYAGIKAVMFRTRTVATGFKPQNGMKVLIRGSVKLYEKDGNIQLYAEEIYPSGIGALYLAFEKLKDQLSVEGLFSPERKRPIPKFPSKIAIVTSPTGAALRDILHIARRRNPNISLLIVPSAVQGDAAPGEIAGAIEKANSYGDIDLLIIGRGGGSLEELWAFNTEEVARAIAKSEVPVVSAVGHEIDYTIADFVADLRAPTPSAAAEMAIPVLADLHANVAYYAEKLRTRMNYLLEQKHHRLQVLISENSLVRPGWIIEQSRQDLDVRCQQLQEAMTGFVTEKSGILKLLSAKLDLLSPLAVLGRGYTLAYDAKGCVVKSMKQIKEGDSLSLKFRDGSAGCCVNRVENS
ncbi:MAG: Exodeoxyribonuclease 7 large subunit [Candidatus Dichloromethanomonas elyunquensis]|nr:MAG: Exodeoxyribonuclease 7 large subunit [Candidatus Dichloromethanomonas elyunquensis]